MNPNTPNPFNWDTFYLYVLPGTLVLWLLVVIALGVWWGGGN
jgi:hypothetical protein